MGVITKSIGTSSRDYSTLQAWEDALPVSLTVDGNSQVGECYNDSQFTASLTISGQTTDATNSITLKCASGQSFYDNANKTTNALKYNQSNGVGVSAGAFGTAVINIVSLNVTIDGLQVKNTQTSGNGFITASSTHVIKNVIAEAPGGGTGSGVFNSTPGKFINVLAVNNNGSVGFVSLGSNSEYYNCTAVQTNRAADSGKGFRGNYDTPIAKNCASFNFAGGSFGSGFSASSNYNAGDDTNPPGANSVPSLTYTSQFVDTSTGDFRAIGTGSLDGAGTRDATNTADLDIVKQDRSTSTPTIGCWEVIASTPIATVIIPTMLLMSIG